MRVQFLFNHLFCKKVWHLITIRTDWSICSVSRSDNQVSRKLKNSLWTIETGSVREDPQRGRKSSDAKREAEDSWRFRKTRSSLDATIATERTTSGRDGSRGRSGRGINGMRGQCLESHDQIGLDRRERSSASNSLQLAKQTFDSSYLTV